MIRTRLRRQVHPLASAQRTDHFRQQGQPAASEAMGPQNWPIARHPVRHPPVRPQPAKNLTEFFFAIFQPRSQIDGYGRAVEQQRKLAGDRVQGPLAKAVRPAKPVAGGADVQGAQEGGQRRRLAPHPRGALLQRRLRRLTPLLECWVN